MKQWVKDIRKIITIIAIILGALFILFVFNQFVQLYQFLTIIHPYVAIGFTTVFVISLTIAIGRLVIRLINQPKVPELGSEPSPEEQAAYLRATLTLLINNPYVTLPEEGTDDERVLEGFKQLEAASLPLIKQNANAIFLTTAISQNGSLDSLVVLSSLVRMIWSLAGIYQTRPSLASLLKLYLQVASVVLMARTLEETDLIEEQMEPLITAILGESIASAIPGMVPVTNLVVSSLMEGSINAFLTLRVGFIAQEFLGNSTLPKSSIRRAASTQSIRYMGSILKDNSKIVVKSVASAAKKASMGTARKFFTR